MINHNQNKPSILSKDSRKKNKNCGHSLKLNNLVFNNNNNSLDVANFWDTFGFFQGLKNKNNK